MNQAETLIILLLIIIAYFLYQIAKQLSYLTGVRIKLPFAQWDFPKHTIKEKKKPFSKANEKENLPN